MTVCFFGTYNPSYPRNRVLIKGLEENGVEVILCYDHSWRFLKYLKLFWKHWKIRKKYDFLLVGFPGHLVIPLAKLISRKPVVFDAFISWYDTYVWDRRLVKEKSFKALFYFFLDWLSCKLADKIILDTEEHIKYFTKTFGIKNKEKFIRIFVGSDDSIFFPREHKKETDKFLVHFHGKYIPVQGVEYIVKAAKLLEKENVQFNLIGNGQTHQMAKNLTKELDVKNINFIDFLPQEEIVKYIGQADVCLGIFGKTEKATRAIPNKVYEAIACKKPTITADTPAIRELFTNRDNCLFCRKADEKDLANKILELKNNTELKSKIAENGYKIFKEKLIPKILGKELKSVLEKFE